MRMLKEQAARTPPPQWVRVVGGFTEYPVRREAHADARRSSTPPRPTRRCSSCISTTARCSTRAALRAVGYTKDTPDPPGGEIERDKRGNPTGLLLAKPNAAILYATLAKGPKLPLDDQLNSTRHFMRELNRLGVTGVIDAGGGFQNYPEDYAVIEELRRRRPADGPPRLQPVHPEAEAKRWQDFLRWART